MRRPHRLWDPRVGDWPSTLNDGRRPSGPQMVDGSAGYRRAASHCGVRNSKRAAPIPGVPAAWCGATLARFAGDGAVGACSLNAPRSGDPLVWLVVWVLSDGTTPCRCPYAGRRTETMNASPLNEIDVATEVSHIGSAPGAMKEKVEALLEPLYRLVPFQGAVIHLVDPDCRRYAPAVLHGYDEVVCRYMASPAITEQIELVGLNRNRAALRGCDLPFPLERVRGWMEYMRPAGFREGVT